jgi:hypothetical protein
LCTLCRRRHNVHYADSRVMPTQAVKSLQRAESAALLSA